MRHFVACLGGIDDLKERDAIDRDRRVILGDDFLLRHVDHLLHHVHLAADAVNEREQSG